MENTKGAFEHPLGEQHLAGCLALSKSANWNQNENDWRWMLAFGNGRGITLADGTLAASALVIPYGGRFAWVSMVLVLPEHRRNGYATRLLRAAIADLKSRGLAPIIDATPAGHEVYAQEGFCDTWGFRRYALSGPAVRATPQPGWPVVRPITEADWPQILALDEPAFGASREALLRALAGRLTESALVAESHRRIAGFLLGRDGREARQIGPLVAGLPAATALLAAALECVAPPIYADIVDREALLRGWLEARGFAFQRPFTRMVHGAGPAPGDESRVMLVAGPELG
ncbi:MAG: GNAT family N-acetyltransferase [Betaproteobacteria bacterium]|nr:GNAT family N-acetyltransferase [Betaproteobacteria bacterium]